MKADTNELVETMCTDEDRTKRLSLFHSELKGLINRMSIENESNTPDFILAEYLMSCLLTFEKTMRFRKGWRIKCLDEKEEK